LFGFAPVFTAVFGFVALGVVLAAAFGFAAPGVVLAAPDLAPGLEALVGVDLLPGLSVVFAPLFGLGVFGPVLGVRAEFGGVFAVPPGVFAVPPGVFAVPPGVFAAPPGDFAAPPGVFAAPPGVFAAPVVLAPVFAPAPLPESLAPGVDGFVFSIISESHVSNVTVHDKPVYNTQAK
jgi:hypothetical protein